MSQTETGKAVAADERTEAARSFVRLRREHGRLPLLAGGETPGDASGAAGRWEYVPPL